MSFGVGSTILPERAFGRFVNTAQYWIKWGKEKWWKGGRERRRGMM